jgi:7,8-dihydro-6-hydroxymethylpterin dimethyltransferase
MNSNGIRLAEDFDLCRRLADLGVYVILSLNTFDPAASRQLHGHDLTEVKQRAIENLARAGVRMTLLCVLVRDVNEDAPGRILNLMRHSDHILSLTVQTMTYTGQGGGQFPRARHIPVDEAARIVARESGGELTVEDFVGRPSAHPQCYRVCHLLKTGERLLPFSRFAPRDEIERLLADSYLPRPGVAEDFFSEAINQLYAAGDAGHLATLRQLIERVYPCRAAVPATQAGEMPALRSDFERQRLAEESVRTVYLHAHMDEDTFDCSRAMLCPDLVPVEPGRLIPACTYNLFYRMQDERFFVAPTRGGDRT